MVNALDAACHQSSDPAESTAVVASRASTGRRGRPRVEIDPAFLAQSLELRGPTHLAPIFNCHPRTVRRRALELQLVQPGAPVYADVALPGGMTGRIYTSSTAPTSDISDDQLDTFIGAILEVFPAFGRNMIKGRLKAAGHRVPTERITAAYLRVHGPPGVFGDRAIHRKVYKVAGANSLAHHDGQHGAYSAVAGLSHPDVKFWQALYATRSSFTGSLTGTLGLSLASEHGTTTAPRRYCYCFLKSSRTTVSLAVSGVITVPRIFSWRSGWKRTEDSDAGPTFGAGAHSRTHTYLSSDKH